MTIDSRVVRVEVRDLDTEAWTWIPERWKYLLPEEECGMIRQAIVGLDADGVVVDIIGYDGGELHDQTLERDWSWVPRLINHLLGRLEESQ